MSAQKLPSRVLQLLRREHRARIRWELLCERWWWNAERMNANARRRAWRHKREWERAINLRRALGFSGWLYEFASPEELA